MKIVKLRALKVDTSWEVPIPSLKEASSYRNQASRPSVVQTPVRSSKRLSSVCVRHSKLQQAFTFSALASSPASLMAASESRSGSPIAAEDKDGDQSSCSFNLARPSDACADGLSSTSRLNTSLSFIAGQQSKESIHKEQFFLRALGPAAFIYDLTSTTTRVLCYCSPKQDTESRYERRLRRDGTLS